jgi:hypothetical protein
MQMLTVEIVDFDVVVVEYAEFTYNEGEVPLVRKAIKD